MLAGLSMQPAGETRTADSGAVQESGPEMTNMQEMVIEDTRIQPEENEKEGCSDVAGRASTSKTDDSTPSTKP